MERGRGVADSAAAGKRALTWGPHIPALLGWDRFDPDDLPHYCSDGRQGRGSKERRREGAYRDVKPKLEVHVVFGRGASPAVISIRSSASRVAVIAADQDGYCLVVMHATRTGAFREADHFLPICKPEAPSR